jgi:hypothetical protein
MVKKTCSCRTVIVTLDLKMMVISGTCVVW